MIPNGIRPHLPEEILRRALSAVGSRTVYRQGKGGMHPEFSHPRNSDGMCDCIGFAAWCLGIMRRTDVLDEGELTPLAIVRDAIGAHRMFTRTIRPVGGNLVVFPNGGGVVGHIGIVRRVIGDHADSVVHCSSANYYNYADAIRETSAFVFTKNRRAIYVAFTAIPNGIAHTSTESSL